MKSKISALVAVGLISISGILVFADNNSSNNEYDPSLGGGCIDLSYTQGEISPEQLDAMGKITNITHDEDTIIIRVEAVADENLKDGIMTLDLKPEARYDIADVIINKDTIIQKGDSKEMLELSELKEGQMVEVKFEGPEGRTYPVKANAYSVTIIEMNN